MIQLKKTPQSLHTLGSIFRTLAQGYCSAMVGQQLRVSVNFHASVRQVEAIVSRQEQSVIATDGAS